MILLSSELSATSEERCSERVQVTVHGRYKQMTFRMTYLFPHWAWKVMGQSQRPVHTAHLHFRERRAFTLLKQEFPEDKWKVNCTENVVSVHMCALLGNRGWLTRRRPDYSTVVMGNKLSKLWLYYYFSFIFWLISISDHCYWGWTKSMYRMRREYPLCRTRWYMLEETFNKWDIFSHSPVV